LTTTQWIALGVVIAFIFVINYALFDAWRKQKKRKNEPIPFPKFADKGGANIMQKLGESVTHPWKDEDQDLQELSRRVKDLKK